MIPCHIGVAPGPLDKFTNFRKVRHSSYVSCNYGNRRFALDGLPEPASADFIRGLHKAFYEDAPEAMLTVGDENRAIRMVPGAFRDSADQEVAVGRHLPPSGDRVEAFMAHFEAEELPSLVRTLRS